LTINGIPDTILVLTLEQEIEMKVYSVLEFVDYEGSCLLGVFGSVEEAVNFLKSNRGYQRQFPGYSYGYVESELGSEIDVLAQVEYL
jgi:hypothetical protein